MAQTMLPTDVTGRQQCRCIVPEALYTVKRSPEDGLICRPKHVRADLKSSINGIYRILLVAYIVVLVTHGQANISEIKYHFRLKVQDLFVAECNVFMDNHYEIEGTD
jgi:hypothetical protein